MRMDNLWRTQKEVGAFTDSPKQGRWGLNSIEMILLRWDEMKLRVLVIQAS